MIPRIAGICEKLESFYKNHSLYLWYVTRKDREKMIRKAISASYTDTSVKSNDEKVVICLFEGLVRSGGLADRFRGILSTFYVCKKLNLKFKLYYIYPFSLNNYVVPNLYDWTINEKDIKHDIPSDSIIVLDTTEDSVFQKSKQEKYLMKHLRECVGQTHVYTNASFSYDKNYHILFNELFKPSDRLQNAIDNQLRLIGSRYVSVSCRFLDLLGDFNETYGYNICLLDSEKENLLISLLRKIEKIHSQNEGLRVLINSDSRTFLNYVTQHTDYTYVIPGEITHIDNQKFDDNYEKYEKTFLDFFMIANADHIYTLKTGRMHNTGYPYAASFVYNKPYSLICF